MLALVRSCVLRMTAFLIVVLPLSMLVAHVWALYPRQDRRAFTLAFSLNTAPTPAPRLALVRSEYAPGTSVVGGPSLSADFINRVLAAASSPAGGTGQELYDFSVQSGIDDAYALAVFRKESSFGRYGAGYEDHTLGNIVCAGYPTCNGRFRWYPSWSDSYADFYRLIREEYVTRGLTTVETITPVYAPSNENDTILYIQQVRASLLAFRSTQSHVLQEVPHE